MKNTLMSTQEDGLPATLQIHVEEVPRGCEAVRQFLEIGPALNGTPHFDVSRRRTWSINWVKFKMV